MKIPMIADKPLSYAAKRLAPGDEFEASRKDARALAAVGKASYRTAAVPESPIKKIETKKAERNKAELPAPGDPLALLRDEYQKVFGKKAFHGWDADTLREKIEAKKAED